MTKYRAFIEKICQPNDFETALSRGFLCIKTASDRLVFVEGHCGIDCFSEEKIILRGKNMRVKIEGKGLFMPVFSSDFSQISGEIRAISFEREGGK